MVRRVSNRRASLVRAASVSNEAKRAKFVEAQKQYKKKWRQELANLEYASNENESIEAIEALARVRRGRTERFLLLPRATRCSCRPRLCPPSHCTRTRPPPAQLVQTNNGDIPEGARKMDLDQIYKRIKPDLGKKARMEFLQLDEMVRNAVRVKNMAEDDGL